MAAMSSAVERGLRTLFKRCVQCQPGAPQCPASCPDDQICSLVPQDCNSCAHMTCIPNPSPAPTTSGPNVGAIAAGVAAGVGFVGLVVFFVWLFWIKKRRAQQDKELEEEWEQDEIAHQKRTMQFNVGQPPDGASTRTRGSLATSILSRASNFIQIAYIPGVTNRNASGRNSVHAPVPPVPAAYRQGQQGQQGQPKSPLSRDGDALFFGIDDLRGSTYSGGSSVRNTRYSSNNRDTRYTVNSITPSLARDSVASDVQWDDATTAPMPASSVPRVTPKVVSLKSATSPNPESDSNSSSTTTPMPGDSSNKKVKEVPIMVAGQGPSNNASVRGKATQVILGGNKKSKGRFPVRQVSDSSSPTTTTGAPSALRHHAPLIPSPLAADKEKDSDSDSGDDEHARARDSLIANIDHSTPTSTPPVSSQPTASPFFDVSDLPSAAISAASSTRPNPYASMASTVGVGGLGETNTTRRAERKRGNSRGNVGALSAVIEEATKRASEDMAAGGKRDPFGDEYAVDR